MAKRDGGRKRGRNNDDEPQRAAEDGLHVRAHLQRNRQCRHTHLAAIDIICLNFMCPRQSIHARDDNSFEAYVAVALKISADGAVASGKRADAVAAKEAEAGAVDRVDKVRPRHIAGAGKDLKNVSPDDVTLKARKIRLKRGRNDVRRISGVNSGLNSGRWGEPSLCERSHHGVRHRVAELLGERQPRIGGVGGNLRAKEVAERAAVRRRVVTGFDAAGPNEKPHRLETVGRDHHLQPSDDAVYNGLNILDENTIHSWVHHHLHQPHEINIAGEMVANHLNGRGQAGLRQKSRGHRRTDAERKHSRARAERRVAVERKVDELVELRAGAAAEAHLRVDERNREVERLVADGRKRGVQRFAKGPQKVVGEEAGAREAKILGIAIEDKGG